jgi:hypothetical protein
MPRIPVEVIRSGEVEEGAGPALSGDHANVDPPVDSAAVGLRRKATHAHIHIALRHDCCLAFQPMEVHVGGALPFCCALDHR